MSTVEGWGHLQIEIVQRRRVVSDDFEEMPSTLILDVVEGEIHPFKRRASRGQQPLHKDLNACKARSNTHARSECGILRIRGQNQMPTVPPEPCDRLDALLHSEHAQTEAGIPTRIPMHL